MKHFLKASAKEVYKPPRWNYDLWAYLEDMINMNIAPKVVLRKVKLLTKV